MAGTCRPETIGSVLAKTEARQAPSARGADWHRPRYPWSAAAAEQAFFGRCCIPATASAGCGCY